MKTIFTTRGMRPRDRLSYWYDVAKDFYVDHECRIEKGVPFNANIEASELGDITVSILECGPAHFIRSQTDVSGAVADHVFFLLQLDGHTIYRQDGREDQAWPTDLVLIDARRPYELYIPEHSRILIFKVPQRAVEQRLGPTIGITAIGVSGTEGLGALVSGFLSLLPAGLPIAQEMLESRIADHAVDLAVMALTAGTVGRRPVLSAAKEVALASLRTAIDHHLGDPDLHTESVARSAGMSVRYASQLMAEQGTTIERYVVDQRLQQCRRVLEDPAQAHRSITDIAMSWGFSDVSHFGRRFKQAFGLSPRDFRAEAAKKHD